MNESTSNPVKALALRIGAQELSVPSQGKKFLLTRVGDQFRIDEIATLGDSDVFVRRDANNKTLQCIAKSVKLFADKKEIVNIKGTWTPTAAGYDRLNQIAGIHLITPPAILDAGTDHPNPYVQYGADGEPKRVIARKIAIGYSPNGNMVAMDVVRHYSFDAYFLQDLQAKMSKPDAVKFGVGFVCPFVPDKPVEQKDGVSYVRVNGKIYIFKPIKGAEGLWININSEEISDVYSQHVRHQVFADVICQRITSRNALKAHPAIATSHVTAINGVAEVLVYGWRNEMDRREIERLGDQITRGEETGVEVTQSVAEAEYSEINAEVQTEIDEFTGAATDDQSAVSALSNMLEQITREAAAKGVNADALSRNLFERPVAELTTKQQESLLSTIKKVAITKQPKETGAGKK